MEYVYLVMAALVLGLFGYKKFTTAKKNKRISS